MPEWAFCLIKETHNALFVTSANAGLEHGSIRRRQLIHIREDLSAIVQPRPLFKVNSQRLFVSQSGSLHHRGYKLIWLASQCLICLCDYRSEVLICRSSHKEATNCRRTVLAD